MLTSYPQIESVKAGYRKYLTTSNYSKSSVKNYVSDISSYLTWLTKAPTTDLNHCEDLRNLVNTLGSDAVLRYRKTLSATGIPRSTINRKLAALRCFSVYLITTGASNINLTDKVGNIHVLPRRKNNPLTIDYTRHLKYQGFSKNTIKNYSSDANHFLTWLGANTKESLSSLSPAIVDSYSHILEEVKSAATRKRKISSLNNFFEWAVTKGFTPNNPFTERKPLVTLSPSPNTVLTKPPTSKDKVINKGEHSPVIFDPNTRKQISLNKLFFPTTTAILAVINICLLGPTLSINSLEQTPEPFENNIAVGTNNVLNINHTVLGGQKAIVVNHRDGNIIDSPDIQGINVMGSNSTADSNINQKIGTLMINSLDKKNNDNNLDSVYILNLGNSNSLDNGSKPDIAQNQIALYSQQQKHIDLIDPDTPPDNTPGVDNQTLIYNSINSAAFVWDGNAWLQYAKGQDDVESNSLSPTIVSSNTGAKPQVFSRLVDAGNVNPLALENHPANSTVESPLDRIITSASKFLLENITAGAKFVGSNISTKIARTFGLSFKNFEIAKDISIESPEADNGKAKTGSANANDVFVIHSTNGQDISNININNNIFDSNLTKHKITKKLDVAENYAISIFSINTNTADEQLFENMNETDNGERELAVKLVSATEGNANEDINSQEIPGLNAENIYGNTKRTFESVTNENINPLDSFVSSFYSRKHTPILIIVGSTAIDANGNLILPKSNTL